MRASGILLPISSLPGKYGIGGFSKEAYDFVDWLVSAGQKYWQILPLGPTGYGDSPYQPFSTFAGNPYFISPDFLSEQGLITDEERAKQECPGNNSYIDYGELFQSRIFILKKAFNNFKKNREYSGFCRKNALWLDDYALYRALKDEAGGAAWYEWPHKYKFRNGRALAAARKRLCYEIDFYKFIEYEFDRQWSGLKAYANERGIKIIGDLPIYVSMDSSDAWSNPKLFKFDDSLTPECVAGCPPDYFSPTGQLWGNPVYDWEYHASTGYEWWIKRLKRSFELYDVIRLDHFRGFAGYYEIPYGAADASTGRWVTGPGMDLFRKVRKKLRGARIIAEDLGYLTDDVFRLIKESGYPGMAVLEFAYDSDSTNLYLPHNLKQNSVVYTGTHDNETLMGWLESSPEDRLDCIASYIDAEAQDREGLASRLVRTALASVADTCIIQLQDWLLLGNEARVNCPSTLGENWRWRVGSECCTGELAMRIKELTVMYGRW